MLCGRAKKIQGVDNHKHFFLNIHTEHRAKTNVANYAPHSNICSYISLHRYSFAHDIYTRIGFLDCAARVVYNYVFMCVYIVFKHTRKYKGDCDVLFTGTLRSRNAGHQPRI